MNSLLALAERNVPRYTSYPTAPHFTAAIRPETYATWLVSLPDTAALSLYIHVPFCKEICLYCGCHTKAARRRDPIEQYAERLIEEIRLVAKATGAHRTVNIAWGGGTPSILGESRLVQVAAEIGKAFDLSGLREHAIELDPRRVTLPLVRALAAIGVNRVSLGVQDFSPQVQEAIGRPQPFETVERVVALLRQEGIARINIDLMYGLPHQTVHDVAQSAKLAATLCPQRLALFGYAHVPWFKKHQRLIDEAALAGPEERLEQARVASETLVRLGYERVGLDHFAEPQDALALAARTQRLHRNFQGYTTDQADAVIGLGASAIGRLPQGYVQNIVDTGGYERAVASGQLATAKGIALTPDDHLRAAIIEQLMCYFSVDLAAFSAAGGDPQFSTEIDALGPFVKEGLAVLQGRRVVVTENGRPFVRLIAAVFDTYLAASRARHSVAV